MMAEGRCPRIERSSASDSNKHSNLLVQLKNAPIIFCQLSVYRSKKSVNAFQLPYEKHFSLLYYLCMYTLITVENICEVVSYTLVFFFCKTLFPLIFIFFPKMLFLFRLVFLILLFFFCETGHTIAIYDRMRQLESHYLTAVRVRPLCNNYA